MSIEDMRALQTEYGTEFAQIYLTGPGRNGRGGTYYLIQGNEINTPIPVGNNVRLINHTHPEIFRGQVLPLRASSDDLDVLKTLQKAGSPQKTSQVIPEVGDAFLFNNKSFRLD